MTVSILLFRGGKVRHQRVWDQIEKADRARGAKDWTSAYRAYTNAVKLDASLAHVWVQLGHAAKETGKLDEAVECYKRAIALEPEQADTYLQIGHAYKVRGDHALACDAYLKSFELQPTQKDAFNELIAFGWTSTDIRQCIFTNRPHIISADRCSPNPALRTTPSSYQNENYDVAKLLELGLIVDADQHYRLYGYREGRDVLQSLDSTPAKTIFILCPSIFKQCGIGEYARYMAISLRSAGYKVHTVRTIRELREYAEDQLEDGLVLVNHGPSLFDGHNPRLSENESTSDLVTTLRFLFLKFRLRPIVYLHSLLDRDNVEMYGRQQLLLESAIPTVTTIQSAAFRFHIPWMDHGVQPIAMPVTEFAKPLAENIPITIGFFGFFHWGGKDFDALFRAAEALRAKLVGNVATVDEGQLTKLTELLRSRDIHCDIGTGWVSDDELAMRLSEADFFYLPQMDYDHWNNSGTARFVTNLCKPLILPPHGPFLDLRHAAIFAEESDVPAIIGWLRNHNAYQVAADRVKAYRDATSMKSTSVDLVERLPAIVREQSLARFPSQNISSLFNLLLVEAHVYDARIRHFFPNRTDKFADAGGSAERTEHLAALQQAHLGSPMLRYPRVDGLEIWRRNYDITDFVFPNVQDVIFSLYRYILKREPSYIEYKRLRDNAPVIEDTKRLDPERSIDWILNEIRRFWIQSNSLNETEFPEISIDNKIIGPEDVTSLHRDLVKGLDRRLSQAYVRTREFPLRKALPSSTTNDRNVFVLLALPASILIEALEQICAPMDVAIDFKSIAKLGSLRQRYSELLNIFSASGRCISDLFICDYPVVPSVDAGRTLYAMSDFAIYDDEDMFIINLVRSLLKRDPLTVEMFAVAERSRSDGRLATVVWFMNKHSTNAGVVDLDQPDQIAEWLASTEFKEKNQLFADFRSAVAGGWNLRNAYLENKRNNKRFWLKMKQHKDVWWRQCGQNTTRIEI